MGGWVSENYISLARIYKWVYSGLSIITEDNTRKGAPEKGGSVSDVINVVKSMQVMISHIMNEEIDEETFNEVTRHIKLFMCMFNKMDCNMKDVAYSKESWISSYNFVCLLNIPQQLIEFGPVKHHWEGGGLGEKIVEVAKNILTPLGRIGTSI